MTHVHDFDGTEAGGTPWTPAFGRLIAMVQGNWDNTSDIQIYLQIRLRGDDAGQTPITRNGIDPSLTIYFGNQVKFKYIDPDTGEIEANFFACDALEGCHYDFRWHHNDNITGANALQGIVKTFAEIPSYLR